MPPYHGWSFGEEKIWNQSAGVIHSFKDALKPALRLVVKGRRQKLVEKHAKRALRNGERSKLANILLHLPATAALQRLFLWNPSNQPGEDVQDLVCGQHTQ